MNNETDNEIKENLEKFEKIKQQIFKAFSDVKLGDGIGFYEANAIDDYFTPNDAEYKIARERDEREDCRKVYAMLVSTENFNPSAHCFMDAKGLHFYMPVILLILDIVVHESVFLPWKYRPDVQKELFQLLSIEQKQAIIDSFAYGVDYEDSVAYYENYKGDYCEHCKKIHDDSSYTKEEAVKMVESTADYKLWIYLKDLFNMPS
jgi:hypothetical protein